MTEVRLAAKTDAKEIIDIYTPSILNAAISFETEVPSVEEMQKRIKTILQTYPWIVCSVDGKIGGYVYGSKYRDREAYQWSCECTAYIHEQFKGKGIGKKLYQLLFQLLKLQGFRTVYAVITLPNEPSTNLHEKCGFEKFAEYENVGYKFGNWHTVGWWKLRLNDYNPDPPPPLKLSELNSEMIIDLFRKTAQDIQSKLTD
jgi:L-amino acid N-acyltransferase YncA